MDPRPFTFDQIADLANQTFILYKLGPLFEFHKTSISVKEKLFAIQLCKNLRLHDGRRVQRNSGKNRRDNVYHGDLRRLDFDTLNFENIPSYDPDIKPLKCTIEILYYDKDTTTTQSFYMLPSPKIPKNEKIPGALVYYPLLMLKTTQRVRQEVIEFFESRYVAACTPLFMYSSTMIDSLNIWIDSIHDIDEKREELIHVPDQMYKPPLVLEYTTGETDLSTLTIKLTKEQVVEMCQHLADHGQFLSVFYKNVESSVNFKLDTLELHRVSTSISNVRKDGYVKISPHAYKQFAVRLVRSWIDLAVVKIFQAL